MALQKIIILLLYMCNLVYLSNNLKDFRERSKRELKFPKGASIVMSVVLANNFPPGPLYKGIVHVLEFDFGFPFAKNLISEEVPFNRKKFVNHYSKFKYNSNKFKTNRQKRSLKAKEKIKLLYKMENTIFRMGLNGRACIIRLQCELSYITDPLSLIEELIFVLFKPDSHLTQNECKRAQNDCPISFLHVMLHSEENALSIHF